MNVRRTIFGCFLLLELCFGYVQPALAATSASSYSGVESSISTYLCTPSQNGNGGGQDIYNCINKLYRFAIVVAGIVGMFMIMIAGYMYMSAGGNGEAVTKAKGWITSSIASLVILLLGYVFLQALNPQLVEFKNIQPEGLGPSTTPPVTQAKYLCVNNDCTRDDTNGTFTEPTCGNTCTAVQPPPTRTSAQLAQQIISNSHISINSSSCDCAGNCPNATLNAIAQGQKATFDGPGTTCGAGKTDVNSTMLGALLAAANSGNSFMITSMTGGHHSSASDPHYQGRAVDLAPQPANAQSQTSLAQSLRSNGASQVALECNLNGSHVFLVLTGSNDSDSRCFGQSGYHIHAKW